MGEPKQSRRSSVSEPRTSARCSLAPPPALLDGWMVCGLLVATAAQAADPPRLDYFTPIGGQRDTELDSYDIRAALGVHFNGEGPIRGDDYMLEIDELFDNGDLASGAFQKIADNRYYYILAEE